MFRFRPASKTSRLVTLLAAGVVVACGPMASTSPPPETVGQEDTTLGAGDRFDVRVYGEAELSDSYQVGRDGAIDFPYVGRVSVSEMEPSEVADLLETRLRDGGVMVRPQISVVVTAYVSKRISVLGAVRNPGNHPMSAGLTALQAVALAGGTTDLANRDSAIITRRVDDELRRYAIPLDRITTGVTEDVRVQAGDIIYVPERLF